MKSVGSKLRYISINCEYVATGTRHDERTVCMVTVVNRKEKIIFSKKIKPEQPIISYLTPLTGLTKKDFTQVEDLTTVMSTVRTLLGPDVILIGQKVSTDINRLGLKKGSNYLSHVDLVDIFKYFHPHYNTYTVFSLYHQANILLNPKFFRIPHKPEYIPVANMKLFNKYYGNPLLIQQACYNMVAVKPVWSPSRTSGYLYEGVCMSAYRADFCTCGAPIEK